MADKETTICIPVHIEVCNLDQLKHLASGADGQPDTEVRVLLNTHGDITLYTTKYISYNQVRNGRNWYLEDGDEPGRYYTDTQLAAQTNIIEAMQKGALIATYEMEVGESVPLLYTVGVLYEGVKEILTAKANNVTWYDRKSWTEILFRPFEIDSFFMTRDNTEIMTLVSGDRLHFSEAKRVNYPPEVDFYDWVKVES